MEGCMSAEDQPPFQPEELGDIPGGANVGFELDETTPSAAEPDSPTTEPAKLAISEVKEQTEPPLRADYIEQIREEFGPPGYQNVYGRLSRLNEPFWAALRVREALMFHYPEENQFYQYNPSSGLYEVITENKLQPEIEHRIYRAAKSWSAQWCQLEELRNTRSLTGILSHLKGQTELRHAFKNIENIFACKNCLIRFKDRTYQIEALPFSPLYRLRHGSPLIYDPSAKCPHFRTSILGHVPSEDQEILQKLAGQALIGRNLIQRFCILDGIGGASKTEFIMTVRDAIGAEGCAELRIEQLKTRFEIGAIARASLLYGPDVPGNFLSLPQAYRVKSLVGGDSLECEFKGSNFRYQIEGRFNIFISSNSCLKLSIDSDCSAWGRRLVVIRFERPYIGKRIPDIHLRLLEEEGSGILNWILEGAQKLLRDIQSNGDICLTARHQSLIDRLLNESDSLAIFLSTSIVRAGHGETQGLSTAEIVEAYLGYCQGQGWDPMPIGGVEKRLPDLMAKLFATQGSHSLEGGLRGFRRVRWKNDH
jgi:hypothetical protein